MRMRNIQLVDRCKHATLTLYTCLLERERAMEEELQNTVQNLVVSLPLLLRRKGLPADVKFLRDRVRCAIYSKGLTTATNLRLITVLECLSAFQSGHMTVEQMDRRLQVARCETTSGAKVRSLCSCTH